MNTTHEGAWSEPKPPTAETQDIADKVKEAALKKLKQEVFFEYKAIEYQDQVVAGMNFKIKVQTTPMVMIRDVPYADIVQLDVYRNLQFEYSLTDATSLGQKQV
ncbi:cystatin-A-like [Dysidea avara]|uniref:cystatin-A-like n=1 Tax=Dysidea avara TaxID=196820 RepID=UPI00331FE4EC